ncbi:MAG: hypothetical protein GXO86_10835 [Chlorobi bacterium]|nr:hypothetical protein [Chlorobiota bacterium]
MKKIFFFILLLSGLAAVPVQTVTAQNAISTPESFFGFTPGADGMLFNYEKLIDYYKELDNTSGKFKLVKIGNTPLGRDIFLAIVSSEENIKNLEKLKKINEQLALNTSLTDAELNNLVSEGKVFVYATLSMHSSEVGPTQASPTIAYNLITSDDPETLSWLDNVVFMFVPNHNPDGMDMVVKNYQKYKGTKYEGASLPGVYHKYIGHDNNRDFIVLTQSDTRAISSITSREWFPQVMVEKHQMGSTGVRYFVPPPHDPIAENVDPGLWNWMKVFGSNMITDMTADSLSGVVQSYIFDDYWPGSTETCLWKNTIAFLTEAASARGATPIYVEPTELRVGGKGLSEYKISINMPHPWPGGWWHLSDIVEYEKSSTKAIIKTASIYHDEILKYRNEVAKAEVERGKTQAPNYYVLPTDQHDAGEMADLVNLLKEHGVEVYRLTSNYNDGDYHLAKGDVVIPMAQPVRPFIKEVMEKQTYPLRHYTPGGKIMKPYDITTWSLPLHKGVTSLEINGYSGKLNGLLEKITGDYRMVENPPADYGYCVYPVSENQSFKAAFHAMEKGLKVLRTTKDFNAGNQLLPAGSFLIARSDKLDKINNELAVSPDYFQNIDNIETKEVVLPRIALMETWFHNMDAGWTRFIFDTYHIPYTVVRPGDIVETDLAKNFDIIVFPDENKSVLLDGKYKSAGYYQPRYPPEYTKGIGKKGLEKIMNFVNDGGKVVSWGRSTGLFEGEMKISYDKDKSEVYTLPFRNVAPQLQKQGLYCPGSFVKVNWKQDFPLTLGMQSQSGIFYRGNPVFTTSLPGFDMDRRVIGWFPEKDILMSGYAEKIDLVGKKVAMVWIKRGKGQMVMYAFSPIFRASTPVTYKLVFNALLMK